MTLKQFEKILDQKLIEGLGLLGFFAGEKNTYQKYFDNDKSGLILIEKTDRRTRNTWFIAPKVLFVHDSIELFAQELAKEFYTPNHIINTISEGLGYLTPQTEYLTWSFTVGEKEDMTMKTLYSLFQTIEKYAIPKIEQLCKDEELLEVMKNNELGIQITNHIKAPILQYIMGDKYGACELATKTLDEVRPIPKNPKIPEPQNFSSPEEAFTFFRRDKDARYYHNYKLFYNRFQLKIKN